MIIEILHVLAIVIIGLYAGSLLTEGVILVPYWRGMDPAEFFRLHGTLGPKLFNYFAPLTTLAVVLAILSACFGNIWQILSGSLCFSALIIFFLYFKKANASFAEHSLSEKELGEELVRWEFWHWLRTMMILVAFATSVIGHS